MKISVSGSAGCGKTVFAGALANHFGLPVIEEGYDQIAFGNAHTPEEFLDSLLLTLETKALMEADLKNFVSDRGPIDLLHLSVNRRLHKHCRERVANLIEHCVKQARTYDLTIFPAWQGVPLQQGEQGGLKRNMDPISQMMMHAQIMGQAHIWLDSRRVIQIPQSVMEIEERVSHVARAIRNRFPEMLQ